MSKAIILTPGAVPLSLWRRILRGADPIELSAGARATVDRSRKAIDDLIATDRPIYAVNTGFGKLASIRISHNRLVELQHNLILSHATGTGALLEDGVVRTIMVMKACALAQGFSGVRWLIVETLLKMVNAGVYPCIPSKGSVGASGDLAPLSHMVAAMMGIGKVRAGGEEIDAIDGLKRAGIEPVELGAKEGVALINGTQVSTALALKGLFAAEDLLRAALVAGALSVDAAKGSDTPFDPRIQAVRGQLGQIAVAGVYRRLLSGSAIRESHRDCAKVQDPYCLRCQPQVMGACLDHLDFAGQIIGREANAVSDNPLVFAEDAAVLSGGNFHAEPVAMASDVVALVIAEIGSMSERRQAMLVDASLSGLPAFITEGSGLNSGFMMAQVTSAALVSENKALAHPSSVDSIPTSANQEDHVSMATYAARRLGDMADNCAMVVAIEWLAAAQGVEFHAPLASSKPLAEALRRLRVEVPSRDHDRFFAPEMETAKSLLVAGALDDLVSEPIGPSYGA